MESIENPVKNPIDFQAQPNVYLNKVNSAELLKELEKTNKRLQANQNRLQKIVRQYTHIVGNTLFPETLYHLAQKLKKNVEFRQDSLLLYDAYHAEVSIRHQSELLRVKLKKNGYTETVLYGYFQELFLNVFKYSDDQPLRLRFYEQNRNKVTYLVSSWENTYLNNTTISTGNGLEGIREDLRMLNDSDEHAKTLQIIDNNAHFRVILCLRKDLLIFEPSNRKYARLQ